MSAAGVLSISTNPSHGNYRSNRFPGVANHEIGTHYLRWFNERNSPWAGERKEYGLRSLKKDPQNHIITEEGLATLHTRHGMPAECTYLYKAALHYYAAVCSSKMNFKRTFDTLQKYIPDTVTCWTETMRVKRGTSSNDKGGYYKDQAYFIGAVQLLRNRKKINFRELMAGKICLDDLKLSTSIRRKHCAGSRYLSKGGKTVSQIGDVKLPLIMDDMASYLERMDEIARRNFID